MAHDFGTGARVSWAWGKGHGHGHVREKFERRVQRTIQGEKIVRNGTPGNPAYLVETEEGAQVLKRGSELSKS